MKGVNKVIVVVAEYQHGKSIPAVASMHGLSRSTVRSLLAKAGVLRSRADGVRLAASEGRLGHGMRGKKRIFSDAHKKAISAGKIAAADVVAIGKSLKPNGYIAITRGEYKNRSEHCVIAEKLLGRRLLPDEVVHHKDRNRSNNEPSNLQVMSRADHSRLHRKEGW